MMRAARLRFLIVLVAVLAWSASASAEKKRVAVPRFDGPQEGIVRKAVMQVLKGDGYEVVGAKEIDGAAKSTGAQLDSNDGFKTVAKELSINAFVTGEVSKKKAKLTVRNGADGSVSGEGAFGGANPAKIAADVRDGFSRRLGSAVERGRAPSGAKKPTAAPVAEAEEPDDNSGAASGGGNDTPPSSKPASKPAAAAANDEAPPAASESSAAPEETVARKAPEPEGGEATGPRALDLMIGFGGFSRSLDYNQPFSNLRSYNLPLGPSFALRVVAYPLGFVTGRFIAGLGLELSLDEAFGVTSSVPMDAAFPTGGNFSTIIHDRYGGGRLRFILGGVHELALFAGGGEHAFAFRNGSDGSDRSQLSIPDTIYRYSRFGVDARFELPGGMTARLSGAYRVVLNQGGQIAQAAYMDQAGLHPGFFPYLTVAGVDFNAELGYKVTPSIEARAGVSLKRYFYSMNSAPSDIAQGNLAAGGAVDQYFGFNFGAAYVFGGKPRGASVSSDASEEPAPKKKKHKKKKGADEDEGDASGGDAGGDDQGGGDSDE
jgi:hypothetical protein